MITKRLGLKIFCVNYDITKQVFFVFGTQKGSNNIHFKEAYYLLSKQSQQPVTMHIIDQFAIKNIILFFAIFLIINAVYLTKNVEFHKNNTCKIVK